jgi:hypothetical protein
VKVLIEITPERYELFLAECDITSREYTILKNGVISRDQSDGRDRRVIEILCDEDEATQLLDAAARLYPDAAPAIAKGLDVAREL